MSTIRARKIFEKINLCGCGTSHWDIILFLLEKAEDHDKNGSFYDEESSSQRWIEFGAKVIDGFGLIEHGTGISYAWLTDEGKWLLEWIRNHGTEDDNWPNWWTHSIGCNCGCDKLEEKNSK